MKSVNSSIALVVLVAFGGLALPCVCSDDPYLELSKYLTERIPNESPDAETLQANVMAAQALVGPRRPGPRRPGEPGCGGQHTLQSLATKLANLYDGENDAVLCSTPRLESLILLMEAALDYHQQPNPSSEVERLNGLLIRLKAKVLGKCFRYIESRWLNAKPQWDGGRRPGKEFFSIIRQVATEENLVKRLICRPKDTPEFINRRDRHTLQHILYSSVLAGEDILVLKGMKNDQFTSHVHERLIKRCDSLLEDPVASTYGNTIKFLLGIENMDLPGDKEYSESDREAHRKIIYPLPLYLVCEWLLNLAPNLQNQLFDSFYYGVNPEERSTRNRS